LFCITGALAFTRHSGHSAPMVEPTPDGEVELTRGIVPRVGLVLIAIALALAAAFLRSHSSTYTQRGTSSLLFPLALFVGAIAFSRVPVLRADRSEIRFFDGAKLRKTEAFQRSEVIHLEMRSSLGATSVEVHLRTGPSRLIVTGYIWPTSRIARVVEVLNDAT
jgi:hypothetical protein